MIRNHILYIILITSLCFFGCGASSRKIATLNDIASDESIVIAHVEKRSPELSNLFLCSSHEFADLAINDTSIISYVVKPGLYNLCITEQHYDSSPITLSKVDPITGALYTVTQDRGIISSKKRILKFDVPVRKLVNLGTIIVKLVDKNESSYDPGIRVRSVTSHSGRLSSNPLDFPQLSKNSIKFSWSQVESSYAIAALKESYPDIYESYVEEVVAPHLVPYNLLD